jgi:hypothetical protein
MVMSKATIMTMMMIMMMMMMMTIMIMVMIIIIIIPTLNMSHKVQKHEIIVKQKDNICSSDKKHKY